MMTERNEQVDSLALAKRLLQELGNVPKGTPATAAQIAIAFALVALVEEMRKANENLDSMATDLSLTEDHTDTIRKNVTGNYVR
jgi:hypothetical protein